MWFLSRLVIVIALLVVAPLLPVPSGGVMPEVGWDIFSRWDSDSYRQIATVGYEYAKDSKLHNMAFFPLFPLAIRGVMALGLRFESAAVLVNNLAFLVALMLLYHWVEERHGQTAAQWATAVLAWCPLSLFGTVIYSEGCFLLFSTAALRAFDKQLYPEVALWGTLATATHPTGLALIPALLMVSWHEHRPAIAYTATLAAAGGILLFSLYGVLRFGDALAFIHAQRGKLPWELNWQNWLQMQIADTTHWMQDWIQNPWHWVLLSILLISSALLWRFGAKLPKIAVDLGIFALILLLWLMVGNPLIHIMMVLGGGYLLWRLRTHLQPIAVVYGFCCLGLILVSGGTWALSRLAYGIVSLAIALGLLLSRYPRFGYILMGFFAIVLASFSVRFAQQLWVA
ncbi:MAG TPA: mannosyltransferase family protein [Cyanophyceae cyanobacterium]